MTVANISCWRVLPLVLLYGQDQDCPGGCFSPANAFDGDMAVLRIWNRVLSGEEIKRNMMRERPESESGLVGLYIFDSEGVKNAQNGEPVALDRSSKWPQSCRIQHELILLRRLKHRRLFSIGRSA
jgi:hypothetical protein